MVKIDMISHYISYSGNPQALRQVGVGVKSETRLENIIGRKREFEHYDKTYRHVKSANDMLTGCYR